MTGIVHKAVKVSGEKGLATEWNDDHEQTGNHDVEQNQFLNNVIEQRTDFPAGPVEGQVVWRSDLNALYIYDGAGWLKHVTETIPPIGSVLSWLKSYTNTPALPEGWVECNGQTLDDAESVYDGQVIPDLNGDHRFLRGNTASGGTGGTETHRHSFPVEHNRDTAFEVEWGPTTIVLFRVYNDYQGTLPTHYEVVWIMRVK